MGNHGETGGKQVKKARKMTGWAWVLSVTALVAGWVGVVSFARAAAELKTEEAGEKAELRVVKSMPGGGEERWDYITVDAEARRIYVAHSTSVMVFDADKGTMVGVLPNTPGVHGVAVVAKLNQGFATNGGDGSISVFDLTTLKTLRKIKAGDRPDAILYDPSSMKIFCFNHGSGDVTMVDPAAPEKAPETLVVGGTLEFGATDEAGHVFVNVEDKNEVVEIDAKENKVLAHWSVAPGEEPTGLAIDPVHGRLFVGCRNQKMIVVDTATGKVLADVAVGAGVDGVAFDAGLGLAMTSNGRDGTLTAVREGLAGTFTAVQTLTTIKGARTIADDPKTHQMYLPCKVAGEGGATTFGILVVGK